MKPIIGILVAAVVLLTASVIYLNSEIESLQDSIVVQSGMQEQNTQSEVARLKNDLEMQRLMDQWRNP